MAPENNTGRPGHTHVGGAGEFDCSGSVQYANRISPTFSPPR